MSKADNLAVAMIVKNEAAVIERCLKSVLAVTDNILVVDTGSTDNTPFIVRGLGVKVATFEWCYDFSAARNFAFWQAEEMFPNVSHLMWIDADDVIRPESADAIKAVMKNPSADVYFAKYVYSRDEFGNPLQELMRERILRARSNFKWEGAVHECISYAGRKCEVANFAIDQIRPAERVSPAGRNIEIYSRLVNRLGGVDKLSTRDLYYSAREFSYVNRNKDAMDRYKLFVERKDSFWEDRAAAFYAMGEIAYNEHKVDDAREFAFKATLVKHTMAEAYCLIGLTHVDRKEYAAAANWYEIALTCEAQRDSGLLAARQSDHYTWLPHLQLCVCYANMGKTKLALEHNDKAGKYRPNDGRIINNRKLLQDALAKKPDGQGKRLNLGCGNKRMEGYVNCDLYKSPAVDEVFSLDEIPYADGTVSALHSEHALEHLPRVKAEAAVKEWARVLKPGGELMLKIPDLELCCRKFVESPEGPLREWYHHTIFGYQASLRPGDEPDEAQFHRCGFTKPRIRKLLEDAGFIIDYLENYDGWDTPSIAIRAVRQRMDLRVGWLADAFWDDGSTRIRCLNVDRWLRAAGYNSYLIAPGEVLGPKRPDILIAGKRWSEDYIVAAEKYKASGGTVIVDLNEDYFSMDWPDLFRVLKLGDLVVCCSTALAKKSTDAGYPAIVIEDGVESIPDLNCAYTDKPRLKAVWMGYGGNSENAEKLKAILDRTGYDLVTIHEHPNADIKWNRTTWPHELVKFDIAIAPQRDHQTCKSNNKMTTYQALGLPVVASPLPAYVEITKESETAFIARNEFDWADAFRKLRDVETRRRVGQAGRASVEKFRSPGILLKWVDALKQVNDRRPKPRVDGPQVDIIIPTYNNPDYLRVCLESIKANTEVPYKVFVVDVGKTKNADHDALRSMIKGDWCCDYEVIIPVEKTNFSASNNLALRKSKAPFICLLNDDTIVTPGWMSTSTMMIDRDCIVGPFSNCDQGWLHNESIVAGSRHLHPGMKLEEVKDIIPDIYEYGRQRSKGTDSTKFFPWLAAYCWVMRREVFEKVGYLDEGFINGGEDVDYCKRAEKLGIKCWQPQRAFVFHFGGKSRKVNEDENYAKHHEEDRYNHERLQKKWAKPLAVIYTGPAFEHWSPNSLVEGGIGGSETAVIHMANELSKLGYRVEVFNDCGDKAGTYGDVVYHRFTDFPQFVDVNYMDVFVASRDVDVFRLPIRAGKKLCWVHDIWLSGNKLLPQQAEKVDTFLCLSPWHKEFFAQHHGIDPDRIKITRNGIDLSRFENKFTHNRDHFRFIYSSSPDRGLDVLLGMWPKIRAKWPAANLRVFYGFDNWNKAIAARGDPGAAAFRDSIMEGLKQPGITVYGRVDQQRLADEMMEAGIWAYPAYFWETFCITALEAIAAGLVPITSDVAALKTTVGDHGFVVPTNASYWQSHEAVRSEDFQKRFLEVVDGVLGGNPLDGGIGDQAFRYIATSSMVREDFTWQKVAKSWVEELFK